MIATIGTFDGIHLGHQYLLTKIAEMAQARGTQSLAVTFHPHPLEIIRPGRAPKMLSTVERRVTLIRSLGIDIVHIINFSESIRELSALEFVTRLKASYPGLTTLVIGYNNHVGTDRFTTDGHVADTATALGVDIVHIGKAPTEASSSAIRKCLSECNITAANAMLGREYSLPGTVVKGHGIGHTLGFPTANIKPADERLLVPGNGVYAATVEIDGERHHAMVNIGSRPTLDNSDEITIEAHLLDFSDDIYCRDVELSFSAFIRHERRFDSLETLRAQLSNDKHSVLRHFNTINTKQ